MNTTQRRTQPRARIDHSELAYRRGFHQAVADVYAALSNGATVEQIGQFEEAVANWREQQDAFAAPPMITGYREGKQ